MGKPTEELIVGAYDHDPADSTVATDVGWVDMKDCESILILAIATALTGDGVTAFTILGNSESDGSGSDVTIKTHAVGTPPDAPGDMLILEATYDEIVAASEGGARYVSANLTCDNAADEAVVVYIRKPYTAKAANSADVIAA